MKRYSILRYLLAIFLALSLFAAPFPADAAKTAYQKTALTGGSSTALDGINGSNLVDGDFAYVMVSNVQYVYVLDADSGAAESSPDVISPDTNAGTKRWILQKAYGPTGAASITSGTISGVTVSASTLTDTGLTSSRIPIVSTGGLFADDSAFAWDASDNLKMDGITPGTSAAKTIVRGSGTAPTTSPADAAQLWVADLNGAAGMARWHQRTESGISSPLALMQEVDSTINPRIPSQGLYTTAAATAAMKVADNANINMGTNNFTMVWKGALPDWTPASELNIIYKYQAAAIRMYLLLETSGVFRVWINGNSYDSTVANTFVDGTAHKIVAVIVRETASTAGSVTFYADGLQLGAAVAITAGAPGSVTSTGDLYVNGFSGARNAGTTYFAAVFNRALSAAEVLNLYRNGIDYADKWGSQADLWDAAASVFTSGTYAWVAYGGNSIANAGNALQITYVNNASGAYVYLKDASDLTADLIAGKRYRLECTASYSGGSAGVKLRISSGSVATDSAILTTTPTTYLLEFTAASATSDVFLLTAMGISNVVTIDNIHLYEIGATLALEPEGIQPAPGQWLDSSSNKNHAMQPSSGSSLTRNKRDFEVRWTNTWAGTHEAQYINGVNQSVLPANCYIDEIIGVVAGGTIEDIRIGDGSATERWVANTTGLAAGTTSFTLANRISDGTNYKLVVDPDANFTGSIAFTIRGHILQ